MNYLTFRKRMLPMGYFNINHLPLWEKHFDRNNLTRWCRKGLLVKLRNQYYAFPECRQMPDFARYMLKEYLQLLILDHLTTTPYIGKYHGKR